MPFIGQDWRAPGDSWMRTNEGWELVKLRSGRNCSDASLDGKIRLKTESESAESEVGLSDGGSPDDTVGEVEESDDWQPLVFLRTVCRLHQHGRSFSQIGLGWCNSRRQKIQLRLKGVGSFLLIKERLRTLSGSARKILLELVETTVLHCLDSSSNLKTARTFVAEFFSCLTTRNHCGSPQLLIQQQETVSNLFQLLTDVRFENPADSTEDRVTLLDLPNECLKAVLRRMPDHEGLLLAATAHQALSDLVDGENSLWRALCRFHFSDMQTNRIRQKLVNDERKASLMARIKSCPSFGSPPATQSPVNLSAPHCQERPHWSLYEESRNETEPDNHVSGETLDNWRRIYFELKKFYGLREVYADMLHLCCFCKGLFWKGIGHPCIAKDGPAPSVRVTPSQFVEMLCT